MRASRLFVLCLAAALGRAAALNPIHESSYGVLPRGNFANGAVFQTAGIFHSEIEVFELPFALNFRATPRLELGGGVKTFWGDAVEDNIPYLVFGAKYQLPGGTSVQADLLVGVAAGAGKGLALGFHHRFGYSNRFYSRLVGKVGFMDALVTDDALLGYEVGFYPTLNIMRPLSLELGIINSSQTKHFDDFFALDMQPAMLVHLGRESVLETAVCFGLAGPRAEEGLTVKIALIYAF